VPEILAWITIQLHGFFKAEAKADVLLEEGVISKPIKKQQSSSNFRGTDQILK